MPPTSYVNCTKLSGGLTAYVVYGMSGDVSTFQYSKRPFEINRLPDSVKLEVVCSEESIDKTVKLITQAARTGVPGDAIIAVQDVERVVRIRDIELLS
jgi:nitrogen regulatory protein PII